MRTHLNNHLTPALILICTTACLTAERPPAPVVDTGQTLYYNTLAPTPAPQSDSAFYGQDAHYHGLQPSYVDNADGTISDLNTGLMWSKEVAPQKQSLEEAETIAANMSLAGHNDWRVPTIKELYSLIDFRGRTGLMQHGQQGAPANAIPFINTDYFDFRYGDTKNGERFIDAQWLTKNMSVSQIMGDAPGLFGVNFADGRIKCYGLRERRSGQKKFYTRYVRGRSDYGVNDYIDNGNGTITDRSTGLTWAQADSLKGMNWQQALAYAERSKLAGHSDWRLPNIKELQSIVDYQRSPDATQSPAIDPIFTSTSIYNEANQVDYPYFWSSTTHEDGPNASQAAYISFGRAIGQMHGTTMDVHAAGAQRSDPKEGEPKLGHGPQGDAQRILNFVRLVRGGALKQSEVGAIPSTSQDSYPQAIVVAGERITPAPTTYHKRHQQPNQRRQQNSSFQHPPHPSNGRMPPPSNGERPPQH